MTKDEAIHKALKVLNCLNNDRVYETAWVKGAINACEEALEQPAQEPVAHIKQGMDGYPKLVFNGTFQYDSIAAKQPDIALYIKEQL